MESRKIVLENLFIGQPWRDRHREETYGHGERGGEDETFFTTSNPVFIMPVLEPKKSAF